MGKPLPAKILNAPQLMPGLEFYYGAFMDLCTCRQIGMGAGPIPWTAVNDYAVRHDLGDYDFAYLAVMVKRLDAAYLTYQDEKRKNEKPQQRGTPMK